MKEITIIIIIVILIVGSGIGIQEYLKNTSDNITGKLHELKTEIESSEKREELTDKINQFAEEIEEEWKEINKVWSTVVLHEELDTIEMSILELKACIQSEEFSDALKEIDKTIFLVGHIKDKESLKWRNIF